LSIGVVVAVADANYESLKIEIDNIKEDIKEIKLDNKEMKDYYRDVIGELKENLVVLTQISKAHEQEFSEVKNEIAEMNDKIDTNINNQKIDIIAVLKYLGFTAFGILVSYFSIKLGL
jgi:septation ring formation regulator EzrA